MRPCFPIASTSSTASAAFTCSCRSRRCASRACLYIQIVPIWIAIVPLLLQIAATVFTGQLAEAYRRRDRSGPPFLWARRFTFASALSGAAWGIGAIIWFSPDFFPAQAFLTLAMLGMTATEFIARCSYRPAYLAHAALSLGPLGSHAAAGRQCLRQHVEPARALFRRRAVFLLRRHRRVCWTKVFACAAKTRIS